MSEAFMKIAAFRGECAFACAAGRWPARCEQVPGETDGMNFGNNLELFSTTAALPPLRVGEL
jgi:hypothetical protein